MDVDQDSVIDRGAAGSKDRVTDTITSYTEYSSTDVRQTEAWMFTTDSSPATNRVSISRASTDGLKSWQTVYKDQSTAVITSSVIDYGPSGYRTNTITQPDGSKSVSLFQYGRLVSVARKNSSNGQITLTTYAYDPHGRTLTVTDARNGATTYAYNDADQVETVTTPAPGTGQSAQATITLYDDSLRAWKVVQPDGTSVTNEYYLTGLLKKNSGSRTYPVEYTYDPQGRMKTMKTWKDFDGGSGTAITTWNYHSQRGWLSSKDYP